MKTYAIFQNVEIKSVGRDAEPCKRSVSFMIDFQSCSEYLLANEGKFQFTARDIFGNPYTMYVNDICVQNKTYIAELTDIFGNEYEAESSIAIKGEIEDIVFL